MAHTPCRTRRAATHVTDGGAGDWDALTLRKKLTGKSVRVQPSVGSRSQSISGGASVKDAETMFQLVNLYFTKPHKDTIAYQSFVNRNHSFLNNRNASPRVDYNDSITAILYGHHPRTTPMTQERLAKANYDRMLEIYRNAFSDASKFQTAIIGKMSLDELRPLICKYLASLPSAGADTVPAHDPNPYQVNKANLPQLVKGDITTTFKKKMDTPLANVSIFFAADVDFTPRNDLILDVLKRTLSIAYTDSVREEKGDTYGVSVDFELDKDDTPDAILLSAFDPVRREVARLALHQLVVDGRIHPARIEEVVTKVQKQLEDEILETGKRTCIDLGIHGLSMELVRLIGRMKYRSSYGQNLLQHSREVANICAILASELGLNPKIAKRAGLLHDIGKVSEDDPDLPHALLGMKLAEQYKEKPEICNAIGAHHEECEMTSLYAPLVLVGDAISGARPGARREVIESYIKRLRGMENLAAAYPGVTKSYAIQAGRELRVIVGADQVTDAEAEVLSGEIAKKIQDEMTYPGQVKITVIRETRSVAYAK
mgnify:CR=1 FL=1